VIRWTFGTPGGDQLVLVSVTEIDGDGRLLHSIHYDADQLDEAIEELDRRRAELVAALARSDEQDAESGG
jgi:hypothetical protein